MTHSNNNYINQLEPRIKQRLRSQFISEICKNSKKITMDVIVIHQADQVIAALDLQKKGYHNINITYMNPLSRVSVNVNVIVS